MKHTTRKAHKSSQPRPRGQKWGARPVDANSAYGVRTSRAGRRRGSKANTCGACPSGRNGKMTRQFRGAGAPRLARHLHEVHGR